MGSACPDQIKLATAVFKYESRWKNNATTSAKRVFEDDAQKYTDSLASSRYNGNLPKTVIETALIGYRKVLQLVDEGNTDKNRHWATTKVATKTKNLAGITTWFKTTKTNSHEANKNQTVPGKREKRKYFAPSQLKTVFFLHTVNTWDLKEEKAKRNRR